MKRFSRFFLLALVLAALYALAVGFGVFGGSGKKRKTPKAVLNDFERYPDDFQMTTGGYVELRPVKDQRTHGKNALQAVFLPADRFFPTPTPGRVWEPSLQMAYDSLTPLSTVDWTPYRELQLDLFNPMDRLVSAKLQVADARSAVKIFPLDLLPGQVQKVKIDLTEIENAGLSLKQIRSLRLSVPVPEGSGAVTLLMDYVRLFGKRKAPPVSR